MLLGTVYQGSTVSAKAVARRILAPTFLALFLRGMRDRIKGVLNRKFTSQFLDRLQRGRNRFFARLGATEVVFHPAKELIGCRVRQNFFVALRILVVVTHGSAILLRKVSNPATTAKLPA